MTSPFHLRPAVASDLDAILALERATDLAPHWPPDAYIAILDSTYQDAPTAPRSSPNEGNNISQRCLFVAEKNGQLVGFAVGLLHPVALGAPFTTRSHPGVGGISPSQHRIAELESVVVSASARRVGIGRALCHAVLDWSRSKGATEVVLEVRANSTAAGALYTRLGFTQITRRPRYYRDPDDDALLMRLAL